MPLVEKNKKNRETQEAYAGFFDGEGRDAGDVFLQKIYDLREYDVSYHVRVSLDNEIRCGLWFDVELDGKIITQINEKKGKLEKAPLRICAFDIETTKAPLKFPDSRFDEIMMISYMIDGQGFLITNRHVVGEDVDDFEYSPKPEYEGLFTIFNEEDERALLDKWFSHMRETKPFIYVSFNGDFFGLAIHRRQSQNLRNDLGGRSWYLNGGKWRISRKICGTHGLFVLGQERCISSLRLSWTEDGNKSEARL